MSKLRTSSRPSRTQDSAQKRQIAKVHRQGIFPLEVFKPRRAFVRGVFLFWPGGERVRLPSEGRTFVHALTLSQDLLNQCQQTAGAAAAHFRLPLRAKVWKGAAGEFKGAGSGTSLDFKDHRSYVPGDDPRHINWQAYARTGQFTMKLYSEEVRPVIDVILDGSASMFMDDLKARRTCELLCFVVQSAQRSGAALNVYFAGPKRSQLIAPESLATGRWMELVGAASSESASPPSLSAIPLRPGSLRVLISDLLFQTDPLPLVRSLTSSNSSGLIFAPFTRAESEPTWDGNYDFKDVELGSRHPHRITSAAMKRYLKAYRAHFSVWQEAALRNQVSLCRLPAEQDFVKCLAATALRQGSLELLH